MEQEILGKIKDFPDFRERRFRSKYLAKLALRVTGLENKERILTLEELAEFAQAYGSYERIWRLVLKENPNIRGSDYGNDDGTKKELEVVKQRQLGYNS